MPLTLRSSFPALVLTTALAGAACAQPLYGVGGGGPSGMSGSGVYTSGGTPVGGGAGMGLTSPMDQLEDFGVADDPDDILICISVDPISTGGGSGLRIPIFNVTDQALKGQAAGDTFYTTEAFNRTFFPPEVFLLPSEATGGPSMGLFNNVLSRNQSGPYFGDLDYHLLPAIGPEFQNPLPNNAQDNLDARENMVNGLIPPLYFTVTADSPSLPHLPPSPQGPSGATIYFDPDITIGGDETLFAIPGQLGLVPADDISALIMWNPLHLQQWGNGCQVAFTLNRGSPTLAQRNLSPADVLTSAFGRPPSGQPVVMVQHQQMHLAANDHVDSMRAVRLINNSVRQTIMHDISCRADMNGDGRIDVRDYLLYLQFYSSASPAADTNGDGRVDVRDYLLYLQLYALGCA
jgi:hypothetical protein